MPPTSHQPRTGRSTSRPNARWIVGAMIAIGVLSMACIGLARHRYGAEVTGDGETCGRPAVPTDKPVAAHSVLIPDEMQPIGFTWTSAPTRRCTG